MNIYAKMLDERHIFMYNVTTINFEGDKKHEKNNDCDYSSYDGSYLRVYGRMFGR